MNPSTRRVNVVEEIEGLEIRSTFFFRSWRQLASIHVQALLALSLRATPQVDKELGFVGFVWANFHVYLDPKEEDCPLKDRSCEMITEFGSFFFSGS